MKKITLLLCALAISFSAASQSDAGAAISHSYHNTSHYPNNTFELPIQGLTDDVNGDGVPWGGIELTLDTDPELEWVSLNEKAYTPAFLNVLGYYVSLNTYDLEIGRDYQFDFKVCTGSTEGGDVVIVVCAHWTNFVSSIIPFPINLLSVKNVGGSERIIDLNWIVPENEGCDIDFFVVLRSDQEINMYNWKNADIVLSDIPADDTSCSIENNFGDIHYFYAIGGCEADGRMIALSSGYQSTKDVSRFSLVLPADDTVISSGIVHFAWEKFIDCKYDLLLDTDSSFNNPIIVSNLNDTSYEYTGFLDDHSYNYWKIKATDTLTNEVYWSDESMWRFGKNTINTNPSAFGKNFPLNGNVCADLRPGFSWDHASDSGDVVEYAFYISFDSQFDSVLIIDSLGSNFLIPQFDLPQADSLFWKVIAYDTQSDSTEITGGYTHFTCEIDDSPLPFSKSYPYRSMNTLSSGEYEMEETTSQPTFSWFPSSDPDGGTLSYTIMLADNFDFTDPEIYSGINDTSFLYPGTLDENEEYFWDVYAIDQDGDSTKSLGRLWSFVVNDFFEPPFNFQTHDPVDTICYSDLEFSWDIPSDPDPNNVISYDLLWGIDSSLQIAYLEEGIPFESTNSDILAQTPKWNQTTTNAFDGYSWYCGIPSGPAYGNKWCQALISREIDLSSYAGDIQLNFMHYYDTEGPNWDGGVVMLIDSAGTDYVLNPTISLYDTDSLWALSLHGLGKLPAYSGSNSSWTNASFDLSLFAGQRVRLKFLFASDEYETDQGWFLDNILISHLTDTLLFEDAGSLSDSIFQPVSYNPFRGKEYFWKMIARDRNSTDTSDYVGSQTKSFVIKPDIEIHGKALLQAAYDHSNIMVVAEPLSAYANRDTTYTDEGGNYTFRKLRPGSYDFIYQKPGYISDTNSNEEIFGDQAVVINEVTLIASSIDPMNLQCMGGDSLVQLFWASPSLDSLVQIYIHRSMTNNGLYTRIDSVAPGIFSYDDQNVHNDSVYFYTLTANYPGGYESDSSNEVSVIPRYLGPKCYVSEIGHDSVGTGSQTLPLRTCQYGINSVRDGDSVIVLPGIYQENLDFLEKEIFVGSLYHLNKDANYIDSTVLDGNLRGRVVEIKNISGNPILSGFTLINGFTNQANNSNLYCYETDAIFEGLIIDGNEEYGLYATDSDIELSEVTIRNVNGMEDIALYTSSCNVIADRLTIHDCERGMFCDGNYKDIIVKNSTFYDNGWNTLYGNYLIWIYRCSVTFENNLVYNNLGYLFRTRGHDYIKPKINIVNSTLVNNTIKYASFYVDSQTRIDFKNVILDNKCVGNTDYEIWNNFGKIINISHSNIRGGIDRVNDNNTGTLNWLSGNIPDNPLFENELMNDYRLSPNSSCINAGDPDTDISNIPFDYEGNPRILGSTIDMGAYETGDYWKGQIDANWHNPANWSMDMVPGDDHVITIPGTALFMPVINTSTACKELFVKDSATVIIQNGVNFEIGNN